MAGGPLKRPKAMRHVGGPQALDHRCFFGEPRVGAFLGALLERSDHLA
jgi:hypothetical protein